MNCVIAISNGGVRKSALEETKRIVTKGGFSFSLYSYGPNRNITEIIATERPAYVLVFAVGWQKGLIAETVYPQLQAASHKPDILWIVQKGDEDRVPGCEDTHAQSKSSVVSVDLYGRDEPYLNLFDVLERIFYTPRVKREF